MTPKVSVIIANRNDVSMLAVTVRSAIEELRPLGPGAGEVVVVDNSDDPVFDLVRSAIPAGYCKDNIVKIIRQPFPCLFSARETAAKNSSGDYIFCLDSHMIIGRDAILKAVEFMDRKFDDPALGFGHVPISWAHQHERVAKHDRDMSQHEFGDWGLAYNHERTITWKGMPWICRKSWFLDRDKGLNGYGALAEHKVSWGGGDMHIGVKPWLLGFKNWAIPSNPCIHIGPFPKVDTGKDPNVTATGPNPLTRDRYRLYGKSGEFPHTFGFLVACYVLGGEEMMARNKAAFTKRFGQFVNVDKWWPKAKELGKNEKKWLDERKVMTFEQLLITKPWQNGFVPQK